MPRRVLYLLFYYITRSQLNLHWSSNVSLKCSRYIWYRKPYNWVKNVPNLNKYKIIILHDIQKCFKQKLSYHFESINQCTYHTLVSYRVYVIQKILLLLMWRCSVFMHFGVVLKLHVIPILLKVKQKETDIKKSGDGQLNYHWWHLVVRFRNVSMRFIAVAVWLRLILGRGSRFKFQKLFYQLKNTKEKYKC